jgi:3-phosphoshikimate 1-carboxyvinyltransferase
MATELRKLGATVEEGTDFIRITPPAAAKDWRAASSTPTTTTALPCVSRWPPSTRPGLPCALKTPNAWPRPSRTILKPCFRSGHPPVEAIPVICVDGPTASGKGTLAAVLAQKPGLPLSGFRLAVPHHRTGRPACGSQPGCRHEMPLRPWCNACRSALRARVLLDGDDVSDTIRTEEAGMNASKVSALPRVRDALIACSTVSPAAGPGGRRARHGHRDLSQVPAQGFFDCQRRTACRAAL